MYPSRTPLSHSGRCQVTCSSAELVVFATLTSVGGVGTVGGAMGGALTHTLRNTHTQSNFLIKFDTVVSILNKSAVTFSNTSTVPAVVVLNVKDETFSPTPKLVLATTVNWYSAYGTRGRGTMIQYTPHDDNCAHQEHQLISLSFLLTQERFDCVQHCSIVDTFLHYCSQQVVW